MRHPVRLALELGPLGFIAFQLAIGGSLLSALIFPVFIAQCLHDLGLLALSIEGTILSSNGWLIALHGTAIGGGLVASAALALCGLIRRLAPQHAWVLPTLPLLWCLLSWAAWRALVQVMVAPHAWEKTEHGLVRRPQIH